MTRVVVALAWLVCCPSRAHADDGHELWLRYRRVVDRARCAEYRAQLRHVVMEGTSPSLRAAGEELRTGLRRLLGRDVTISARPPRHRTLVIGTRTGSPTIAAVITDEDVRALGTEGFLIRAATVNGRRATVIAANSDVGVLYGVFRFLAELQRGRPLSELDVRSAPAIQLRLLDHWDNLNGSVERGYAGSSLWEWGRLPAGISPRYRDYARANASIGINGSVLTNVNADAKVLTTEYLVKAAAIAGVLRPYGVRVYLTARFSAPIELGFLPTADPLNPAVREWWRRKADEVYAAIPDFGGFLVKANSEGQPGPQEYGRTHSDGANMLAEAVGPHGGVVIWRAFVYSNNVPVDRVMQAYDEFVPLDGRFRANVLVQVKNGPLDFQPREPFHPLFGAMPKTPLMLELQITKEYLGEDTHLVYLGTLFEEALRADTYRAGHGSTVAHVVDGSLHGYARTGIAGVANVGTDLNWTGSIFNQANWYAFGRLAWEPTLSAEAIADEWIRRTLSSDSGAVSRIRHMMLVSREAAVSYMTPLGLAHIMATGHHYGPGPWAAAGRPDWTPAYYHRADSTGVGFDRTAQGSNAVAQYADSVRNRYGNRATVPDSLLLWFHHVGWRERLSSGRNLWEELVDRYNAGVDTVRAMQRLWDSVKPAVDDDRFRSVQSDLAIQEREARWWRDAVLQYFQTFSRMPIPGRYEQPAHTLEYYMTVDCPRDPRKPRCAAVP
ncbi:MAG: alpha-glucuronidase family glycosyl hydrolase [Gemmatimonadaceae bacterium]